MRRINSTLLPALVATILLAAAGAQSATLSGYILHVYQRVNYDTSQVYLYTASGDFCGAAILDPTGASAANSLAFRTAMDLLLETSTGYRWTTWYTEGSTEICDGSYGKLISYYVRGW